MSRYRIRKGGREFEADQPSTLRELIERGLLDLSDRVSVDGGDWVPVGALPELADAPSSDAEAIPHLAPDDLEPAADRDALLAGFLDQLDTRPLARAASPVPDAVPAAASVPEPPRRADEARNQSSPPGAAASLPPDAPALQPSPAAEPPSDAPPPDDEDDELPDPLEALMERAFATPTPPARAAGPPPDLGAPPSFDEWMQSRSGPKVVLADLGLDDGGVRRLGQSRTRRVRPAAIVLAVLLGGCLLGARLIWIHTAATTTFPKESELNDPWEATPSLAPEAVVARDEARAECEEIRGLRESMGDPPWFGDGEQLEDLLFTTLTQVGAAPAGPVDVEVLRDKSVSGSRQPVLANVHVLLRGLEGEPEGAAARLRRQLVVTWVVVAKFSVRRQIEFRTVSVEVMPPTPWNQSLEGASLVQMYECRRSPRDLMLGK